MMNFLPRRKSSNSLSLRGEKGKQRGLRFSLESPTASPTGCSSADEGMIVDSDNENDMPDTGPAVNNVLKDVVAYVEVRTKMENRSNSVRKQLERLGAVVVDKFTSDEPVTHVIWKDGKKSTKDKAIKRGVHLVSVLWVDSCKQNKQRAPESLFPVTDSSDDGTIVIPKAKRMKSMQPKSFEEDLESSAERMVRKRKKKETGQSSRLFINSPGASVKPFVYAAETQDAFTPVGTPVPGVGGTPSLIPDTPASMRACLNALGRVRNSANTPISGSEKPAIGESPTFGAKPDILQKKLSFGPSINADSITDGNQDKTMDPNTRLKKGRRSEVGQLSAKQESSKVRRLSLRIEKTLSEQETDEDLCQSNGTDKSTAVPHHSPVQKCIFPVVPKISSDSRKPLEDKSKTQANKNLFCETNAGSHSELPTNGRRKRKLLSTNTDTIPDEVLTQPTESSTKEKQQKDARLSGKSSRNLSDKFEKAKDGRQKTPCSSSNDECLQQVESPDPDGKPGSKPPRGGKTSRKRKKEELLSESSEDESSGMMKRRKGDSEEVSSSLVASHRNGGDNAKSSRKSLDNFTQNKRQKQVKATQKANKNRSASLSTLNLDPTKKAKDDSPKKPKLANKKGARSLSLTGESTTGRDQRFGKTNSEPKPRKELRNGSELQDDSSDSSSSSSPKIEKPVRQDRVIKIKKSTKKLKDGKPSLVMTSVHAGDQDLIAAVVKRLRGFAVEDTVSKVTTHVVCGESRRTLNLLRGIASGCWLLSTEWVLKSLEAEKWLPEEPYEIQGAFPAAKMARLERSKAGKSYQQDLLSSLGPIFVHEGTSPPKTSLAELVHLCGGRTCSCAGQASLCIGGGRNQTGAPAVSEKWLLDCISQHEVLPVDSYLL